MGLLLALVAGGGVVWFLQGRGTSMPAPEVTDVDVDQLRSFSATRVFFGHQSVGANVISGVELAYSAAATPGLVIAETRDHVPTAGGFLAHAYVGANGDPYGKIADFEAVLDGAVGDEVDVAVLKFCYVDVVAGTDVQALFDAYVSAMRELETRHPSVRLLYATVPLTTDRGWKSTVKSWIGQDDQMGPEDNIARQSYNELIRSRFGGTGRLFDVAAVEATMPASPTQRQLNGRTYYVLSEALAADAGHLNELGSRLAAAEFVRVVVNTQQ